MNISNSNAGDSGKSFTENFLGLLVDQGLIDAEKLKYALRVQGKLESPKPILLVLCDLGYVTHNQLVELFRNHPVKVKLGLFLVEFGYITNTDLDLALAEQRQKAGRKRLGEILVERNLISEMKMLEVLADLMGISVIDLSTAVIDQTLMTKPMLKSANKHCFLPIEKQMDGVLVAFGDPLDQNAIEMARHVLGAEIIPAVGRYSQIMRFLLNYERNTGAEKVAVGEQSAVAVANRIFEDAIRQGASDIHIEPLEHKVRVRQRIDGVMVHYRDFPVEIAQALISRIKVMAGADIAEKRRHQDGRVMFEQASSNRVIDMRASFFSTINGEKIVLRLLNRKTELLDIHEVGMAPLMLERFVQDSLDVPTGVVIITGPTGSGKTTTLYSAVDYLNAPEVSIVTAEDPVEYVIDGVAQCSINPKINLTYEETLRHIVRQDPDIIVLGEIRDKFSADTAIQAALTGHKVLTTFHTEDSIGGLLRLLNMEIEAFLISSTVVSVVAQRLLRRVCRHCAEPFKPDPALLRRLNVTPDDIAGAQFLLGKGCEKCRFTGYSGRVCVFELLSMNELVKDAILQRKTSYEIRRVSLETAGLVTLLEDGLVKAAAGATSLQEVIRNLPRFGKPRPLYELRRLLGSR
ncbi:GspE/PulE family protein [Methylomonas sp. BW4-1]|uniref:ATPase, T2SS/T4P/T4SS family n=1 Tax=Methylomonas defluvii TaxID=3045149 RepID=A0ABU4UHH1_9GAMM|nr:MULTISPECIES: GspE/PulE family protein [unclassified Methylomonas]MDX8128290.1 ATPase, T2SS/T4P/T4SS family [Methylomonas sp. OY6]NOV32580.1 type II/IV secretion system protein [Methylomonas sp. ZR1]QBC29059.1 type II/IV secretion system protein [Methylomonas sp. LW13]